MLVMVVPLLLIFYILDSWYFRREDRPPARITEKKKVGIEGIPNIILLG